MGNLIDGMFTQMNRARELLQQYEALPDGSGVFGAMFIKKAIQQGEAAIASGDVVQMLQAYHELENLK